MRNEQSAYGHSEVVGISLGVSEVCSLRKHAYSNILKILQPKTENFQVKKKSDIFHISAQHIDCGYSRGGSNE